MTRDVKEKTLGDYLVIAICPLLIMALVGSAAFYLLEIGYHGQWAGRLQWTLFWFVLAAVLISRVSIEQGSTYANVYGFLLALVTGGQIYRLAGVTLIGWGLLAFIWWCTSKLTWDCTLVDDEEDASGEGLLQVAGLEKHDPDSVEAAADEPAQPWWKRYFLKGARRGSKPHAPGSWVIYFSLLALPAFGVGQMFFSEGDVLRRDYGFKLLWIYVAAALGLLLATSFLGLRRYLRQRSLPMPASMAGLWMVLGTLLAGAIMLACLLLPRPGESGLLSRMVNQTAEEVVRQASKYAILTGNSAQGEGRRIGTGEGDAKEQSQESGRQEGDNKNSKQKADVGGGGKEKSPNAKGSSKDNQSGQSPATSATPKVTSWLADAIKWLIYGLIAGGITYVLYRQRRDVLAILQAMWAALAEIYWSLFSWTRRKPRKSESAGAQTAMVAARKFASLENPFATGMAQRMSPEELVACTFGALEVWAEERGMPRLPDETPLEFARKLAAEIPAIGGESRAVALLYTRIAYAEHHPNTECLAGVARLWEALETLNWNMPAGLHHPPEAAAV